MSSRANDLLFPLQLHLSGPAVPFKTRSMKYFLVSGLFLVALSSTGLAQSPTDETAAVLAAEKEGCLAYQNGDAEKIAQFLNGDYTLTDSKGEITKAADDIADAKTGKAKYDVFENYDMQVRVYNHATAIVLGKTKVKGTYEGKPVDIVVQFTDTFVKQEGQWRLAAGHVSRLKN